MVGLIKGFRSVVIELVRDASPRKPEASCVSGTVQIGDGTRDGVPRQQGSQCVNPPARQRDRRHRRC